MLSKITLFSFFILFVSSLSAKTIGIPVNNNQALAEVNVSIEYDAGGSIFVENCQALTGKVKFTLETAVFEEKKYVVNLSGIAQRNVDYTISGLTDTITFPATTTELEFDIAVIMDNQPETPEDIVITVFDLNQVNISSVNTTIYDFFEMTIGGETSSTLTACRGDEIILNASSAASYIWQPAASLDNNTSASVKYISNASGSVTVSGTLGSCTSDASVNITLINSSVILTSNKDTLCGPESVTFTSGTAVQGGSFSWSPADLFPNQNQSGQTVTINENTDVIVTYTVNDCATSDTINIVIREGVEYIQPFTDTLVCKGEIVLFGDFTNAKNYEFDPVTNVNFSDVDHPYYVANKDASFKVIINSTDALCSVEYNFDIKVEGGNLELKTEDTIYLCKEDSSLVRYSFTPTNASVIWTPNDQTFVFVDDSSFYVKPKVSTTYNATMVVGDCTYTLSVFVKVDSIPALPIEPLPLKPFYCKGEYVTFSSPHIDKFKFPDITFDWGSPLGGIPPLDQSNLTVITQDTFLYIRKTTNGGCYQEDSINLDVKVPLIQFSLTDTTVCANDPVPVTIITDLEEPTWEPGDENLISCNDCLSVIITTPDTQTFTVEGKSDGCPASATMTVNIRKPVIGLTVNDTTICPNEPVEVSVTSAATNLNWSPSGGVSCPSCTTTVITTSDPAIFTISGIQDGCPAYGGLNINISAPINFALTVSPTGEVAIGNPVTVSVVDPIPGASYQWKVNGRDLGIHGDSYEIVVESGDDIIEAILVSGQGGNFCTGNGSIKVAGVTPYIDIPNAFTPNGDSKNDVFKAVVPDGVNILEITIVNRWGQKVFSSTNSNDGWDGNFNEKEAPSDTYVFVIKYQLSQGGIIESRRGEVSLYR